jgi:cation:H+ antiporter
MFPLFLIAMIGIAVVIGVRLWLRERSERKALQAAMASATVQEIVPKLWPFPAVLSSAFMLAWATEVAQFFMSRGLALAILAFLEVLPEFSVEAAITYNASAVDPNQWMPLITANFTGANRLLVGLGIPLVFFLAYALEKDRKKKPKEIRIEHEGSVEVTFLVLPTLYSFFIVAKGTLTLMDTVVLGSMYAAYLYILYKLPVKEDEEVAGIPGKVLARSKSTQISFMLAMFVLGAAILFLSIDPFVENTKEISVLLLGAGSTYFFFQWIAPLLSESPELLTVSYWVRRRKTSAGLLNVVSSKINQWTLLIAMIPAIFTGFSLIYLGVYREIRFDQHQRVEVLLTAAQSLFAAVCLMKLRVVRWEFLTLFTLWSIQLFDPVMDPALHNMGMASIFGTKVVVQPDNTVILPPYIREMFVIIYLALVVIDLYIYRKEIIFFKEFKKTLRLHVHSRGSRTR